MSPLEDYPAPSRQEKVPFTTPGTTRRCNTAVSIYGDVHGRQTPLIAIHGGPGAPSIHLRPMTLLHRDHGIPVILYDQLGCGDSTRLPETEGDTKFWTVELFVAELQNIIRRLGLSEYDILGHSWGAIIAGFFILTQPKGLRKLIVYSSATDNSLRSAASCRQRDALPQHLRQILEKGDDDAALRETSEYRQAMDLFMRRHRCRLDPYPPTFVEAFQLMAEDETVASTMYSGTPFRPASPPPTDTDLSRRLREITEEAVPGGILLMNGKYDFAPDETMVAWTTEPNAKVVEWVKFEESSHMAHYEEPEKFLATVAHFVKSDER